MGPNDYDFTEVGVDNNSSDYILKSGAIRDGIEITPNNDLTFNSTIGDFTEIDPITNIVNTYSILAKNPVTFRYLKPDLTDETLDITLVDPTQYYVGNILNTLVAPQNSTFQKVYMNLNGDVRILRGDIVYADLNDASLKLVHEKLPSVVGYVFIGGFLMRKDCGDLTTPRMRRVYASKFGEVATIGGGSNNDISIFSVKTIAEMEALIMADDDVAIVSDSVRGGIFVQDSTQTAGDNQGTNFNGKIRQYDGLVKLEWFIPDLNADASTYIISVMNEFGYVSFDKDIKTNEILTSLIVGDIRFLGNKINKITAIGVNSFLNYDAVKNLHNLEIDEIIFDGFNDLIKVVTLAEFSSIDSLKIINNKIDNCKEAFIVAINNIASTKIHSNIFGDMITTANCRGILIGTNSTVPTDDRGNYSVYNNHFSRLETTAVDVEVHAIALYGKSGNVYDNHCLYARNHATSTTGAEAFYFKLQNGRIWGNYSIDGGYSDNGAFAIKGANTEDIADVPLGNGVRLYGNHSEFTDITSINGIGIFCQNDEAVIENNYIKGATHTAIVVATEGKFVDIINNTVVDHLGQQAIHHKAFTQATKIFNNDIEIVGVAGLNVRHILVSAPINGTKNLKIHNNTMTLHKNFLNTTSSVRGVEIGTVATRLLEHIELVNNTLDPTNIGAIPIYDVFISGNGTLNGLTVTDNKNLTRANLGMIVGSLVNLLNTVVERNQFEKIKTNGSGNLSWGAVDTIIMQTNPVINASYDVITATEGKHHTFVNANAGGSLVIDVGGTGTFRGGFTRMTMTNLGTTKIRCYEDGFWDTESNSATLSFSMTP